MSHWPELRAIKQKGAPFRAEGKLGSHERKNAKKSGAFGLDESWFTAERSAGAHSPGGGRFWKRLQPRNHGARPRRQRLCTKMGRFLPNHQHPINRKLFGQKANLTTLILLQRELLRISVFGDCWLVPFRKYPSDQIKNQVGGPSHERRYTRDPSCL